MSDDDIDFLLGDDEEQLQPQQAEHAATQPNLNNLLLDRHQDDDKEEQSAFAGLGDDDSEEDGDDDEGDEEQEQQRGQHQHDEEEVEVEEETEVTDGADNNTDDYHFKKLRQQQYETDDGDWAEDDVKVLIAKVEQLKVRFNKVSATLVAHPLIWVPLSASSAHEAKSVYTQQAQGSVYFVNGLAKVAHRLDTEIRLLSTHLSDGAYSRAKCNNLAFLEIFVRLLEVEKGILFVSTTLPLRAKKAERSKFDNSIDLDLVTRGGLRWIKIRGSSARNLEADAVAVQMCSSSSASSSSDNDADDDKNEDGNDDENQQQETRHSRNIGKNSNDDDDKQHQRQEQQPQRQRLHHQNESPLESVTPFARIIQKISTCATENSTSLRLPFAMRPEALLVCSDTPSKRTLEVLTRVAPNVKCIDLMNNTIPSLLSPPQDANSVKKSKKCASGGYASVAVVAQHGCCETPVLPPLEYTIECVNFDVTAMVAICSDITNNEDPEKQLHSAVFPSNPVLQRQADSERDGQLCVENFLLPVLEEFSEVQQQQQQRQQQEPQQNSSSSPPSAVSQRVRSMMQGTALELVLSRPDHGASFWKPLLDGLITEKDKEKEVEKKKKNSNASGTGDDDAAEERDREARQADSASRDFLGLPPRCELRQPGCLFGARQPHRRRQGSSPTTPFTIPTNWIAAKGAIEEFAWIVETISGPQERSRAVWLLHRIKCVDTDIQPGIHDRLRSAFESGAANGCSAANSVKQRQLNVFSLGDFTNSVTLSANKSFLHTAFECGQLLCCSTHPARALTERKRLGTDIVPAREHWRSGNKPKKDVLKF